MKTLADIISKVQKMRDETAMTCEDMVLSDGTVMYSKEQGLAHLALYDKLLDDLKHQGETVEADAAARPV